MLWFVVNITFIIMGYKQTATRIFECAYEIIVYIILIYKNQQARMLLAGSGSQNPLIIDIRGIIMDWTRLDIDRYQTCKHKSSQLYQAHITIYISMAKTNIPQKTAGSLYIYTITHSHCVCTPPPPLHSKYHI